MYIMLKIKYEIEMFSIVTAEIKSISMQCIVHIL